MHLVSFQGVRSPPLGENPFQKIKEYTEKTFLPSSEKYVSPAPQGKVKFDYSNNNGRYCIGAGPLMFETSWSKSSDRNIYLLNDPQSIATVAVVKDKKEIWEVEDARAYDGSSRKRKPNVGQIAILQNANGLFRQSRYGELKMIHEVVTLMKLRSTMLSKPTGRRGL